MKDYEGLLPAFFPPNNLNADVKKLNEQMNRYNIPSNVMSLAKGRASLFLQYPILSNTKVRSVECHSWICLEKGMLSAVHFPWYCRNNFKLWLYWKWCFPNIAMTVSLHMCSRELTAQKACKNRGVFWSIFFHILTENGDYVGNLFIQL